MSRGKRGLFLTNCLILSAASFTLIVLPSSGAGASSSPTLTVNPSTGVRAEQTVTASGTNWPKGSARLFECGRSEPDFESSVCHSISTFDLTRSSWSKSFESLVGTVGQAGSYCLDPEGKPFTCYVEFQDGDTTVSTPITFKALKIGGISNGGSYENGTSVHVTLANFPTRQKFTLEICPGGNDGYTQCGQSKTQETGASGSASFPNYQLNCVQIDPSGACYLVVTDASKPRGPWSDVGFSTYGL